MNKLVWKLLRQHIRPTDRFFSRQPLRYADCIAERTILSGRTPHFHTGRQLHEEELYHRHQKNQYTR